MITEGGWGWRATGFLTETRRHGGFFRGGIRLRGDSVGRGFGWGEIRLGGRFGWGEMFDWWWVLVGWWGGELGDADDAAAGVLVD